MAEDSRKSPEEILCLSFNQDASCLAVGRPRGFDIFSTESTALLHREDCGVVKLVEMLFRTSLVALVGDNLRRQLTMWNTKARAGICSLQFPSEISSVKMNQRRAVVLLRQKVHIFDLKTMKVLHVIDRSDQAPGLDPGLCSLCCDPERGLLAAPLVAGSQGASLEARAGLVGVVDTYTLQPLGAVLAHRTPVRAMRLNPTGQLLATASARGTVLRLWAVPSFTMLCSFRRGANECCIHGLAFATDSSHLMAAAANGTVHIFRSPREALDCVAPFLTQEPVEAERLQASEPEIEEDDDFSDWHIVDCDRSRVRHVERQGLQGHVHKVKSILTQLWQPCRDYLDGPGAVAWVHQGKEESNIAPRSSSPRSPPLGPLLPLPSAMLDVFTPAFLACLLPHASGGRLVVASRTRNMLSTFDWNKGEGLLASRQVLAAPAQGENALRMTALLQTPPMHPISPTPLVEASPEASPAASPAPGGEAHIARAASPPPFELDEAAEGHVEMELVVQDDEDTSRGALESRVELDAQDSPEASPAAGGEVHIGRAASPPPFELNEAAEGHVEEELVAQDDEDTSGGSSCLQPPPSELDEAAEGHVEEELVVQDDEDTSGGALEPTVDLDAQDLPEASPTAGGEIQISRAASPPPSELDEAAEGHVEEELVAQDDEDTSEGALEPTVDLDAQDSPEASPAAGGEAHIARAASPPPFELNEAAEGHAEEELVAQDDEDTSGGALEPTVDLDAQESPEASPAAGGEAQISRAASPPPFELDEAAEGHAEEELVAKDDEDTSRGALEPRVDLDAQEEVESRVKEVSKKGNSSRRGKNSRRNAAMLLQTQPMQPISPTPLVEASPEASPAPGGEVHIARAASPTPFELDEAAEGHAEEELVAQDDEDTSRGALEPRVDLDAQEEVESRVQEVSKKGNSSRRGKNSRRCEGDADQVTVPGDSDGCKRRNPRGR